MEEINNHTFVIARHLENTGWANGLNQVIVQKDVDLPNKGREASSYVWYIIQNYYNLPDYITFCQGWPFDHAPYLLEEATLFKSRLEDYPKGYCIHGALYTCNQNGDPHHPGLQIADFAKKIGLEIPAQLDFIVGAQFTTKKELILSYKLSFWEELCAQIMENGESPWIMERLWIYILQGGKHEVV